MSSSRSSLGCRKQGSEFVLKTTSDTKTSESIGPYDRAFQQHLVDFGIYPDGYEYPDGRIPSEPENIKEIARLLAQRRPSLSRSWFSREDFRKFKQADTHAAKKREVTTSVIPIIEGDIGDNKCVAGQIRFTNLDHLTDGSLVPGNPDLYYGARPEQLDRQVRAELGGRIIPSTQQDLPIVPNFFLAAKGPDGSLVVAQRQACYDGALGARGMQDLFSYGKSKPIFDNHAYTITCTYHGGTLKMFTSHPIPPANPGVRPKYVTTQIKAYALTSDYDTFRQGAAAYRNGRDWAKRQRDEAIQRGNERVANIGTRASHLDDNPALRFATASDSSFGHVSQGTRIPRVPNVLSINGSDTSPDELSLDPGLQEKRHQGPAGFRRKRRGAKPNRGIETRSQGTSQPKPEEGGEIGELIT